MSHTQVDQLTRQALAAATALIAAAETGDQASMRRLLRLPHGGPPTITDVARFIAPDFGTTTNQILSGNQAREATDARQALCYAAHLLGHSYSSIGRAIERDHSTVMHACTRVGETPRLRAIATRTAEALGWDRNAA